MILIAVTAALVQGVDSHEEAEAKTDNVLVGNWKAVTRKYGGADFQSPEGEVTLKQLRRLSSCGSSMARTECNPHRRRTYTIKGNEYVETPEYGIGSDVQLLKGKAQSFTWKVEGNKWYHVGTLRNGLTIDEVWERIEKK